MSHAQFKHKLADPLESPSKRLKHDAPASRAVFMFVCGAAKEGDRWQFANFYGVTSMCRAYGVSMESTFWNCFPLDEYFNNGHDSIPFGVGADGKPTLELLRSEFNDPMNRLWEWKDPLSIKHKVVGRLHPYASDLNEGEALTFFLTAHASRQHVRLGAESLLWTELASCFSKFRPGVKVNLIVQSCFSGTFVDHIQSLCKENVYAHSSSRSDEKSFAKISPRRTTLRGSYFSTSFVESMESWLKRSSTNEFNSTVKTTLRDHIEYVNEHGQSQTVTGVAHPHEYTDHHLYREAINILWIMYNEYDIHPPQTWPAVAAASSITPITPSHEMWPTNEPSEKTSILAAETFLSQEFAEFVDRDIVDEEDAPFFDSFHWAKSMPNCEKRRCYLYNSLNGMRWRIRAQESFFIAAYELLAAGCIPIEAWEAPMDLVSTFVKQLETSNSYLVS